MLEIIALITLAYVITGFCAGANVTIVAVGIIIAFTGKTIALGMTGSMRTLGICITYCGTQIGRVLAR